MTSEVESDVTVLRRDIASGFHRLRFGSISVPIQYHRGTNDILIVIFHGAVDQTKRKIPKYQSMLPDLKDCHQLSIADPTLELDSRIRSGWYIGGATMPLQLELPDLLQTLFRFSGVRRRIYLGGSSGGFAALYYSLLDPESICVAVNPQTTLAAYRPKPTEQYLRLAWPDIGSFDDIGDRFVTDLPAAYSKGFCNMVVYLQSVGDMFHYTTQMPAFCRVGLDRPKQFVLQCGYWGIPDHSNSIPSVDYYSWIKAIVAAPWFDRQAILDSYHGLATKYAPAAVRSHQLSRDQAPKIEDLQKADLLRDHHLHQPMEC
jgi:hypothetical protein